VLAADCNRVGTCFQVAPSVLVTVWHVLDGIGGGVEGAEVAVVPLAGGESFHTVTGYAAEDPGRAHQFLTAPGE
jgi:hypothetical protein